MVVNHYRHGGSYPHGGARRIHECITETIEAHGGVVAVKAPVERILLEGRKAVGVRLESGVDIRAKRVISGAGVHNTFLRMLPDDLRLPFDLHGDLARVGRSLAHNCVYVGFDREAQELGLPKFNYWLYDRPPGEQPLPGMRLPSGYFSFPSAKDPEWPQTHPGTATAQLIGLGDYNTVAAWEDKRWCRRGEDYEAMKEEFAEGMLERLYTLHPETRGHVVYHEVSTPLSTRHFANYDHGQIYGLAHTPARFELTWLRPHTPIGGLFLTGQDVVSAGVAGALFSGIVTASAVLRGNALKMIMNGRSGATREAATP
jgi:phytoene dehydrogenase-like protein